MLDCLRISASFLKRVIEFMLVQELRSERARPSFLPLLLRTVRLAFSPPVTPLFERVHTSEDRDMNSFGLCDAVFSYYRIDRMNIIVHSLGQNTYCISPTKTIRANLSIK